MRTLTFFSAATCLICATASSAQDKAVIDKAVTDCVRFVQSFAAEPGFDFFYKRFDAYYNAATGLVQNNATVVGDQAALFQFNKCMAQRGLPLGAPAK